MIENSSQSAIFNQNKKRTTFIFIMSVCFLFILMYLNLAVGSSEIKQKDLLNYFFIHDNTKASFIIQNVRMPRMIGGLIIGGSLAVAGLLMQVLTRNPLASPQIFGVNSGASFVVVLITVLIPTLSDYTTILAFIGAFIGGLTVYVLSGTTRKITPIKLALAGIAIHLFFSSLTQGIIILNENSNETVMFWLVGALTGLKWTDIVSVVPWLFVALIFTVLMGRQYSIMELGDDIATSLGQNTKLIRIITGILVIVLAGASVSIVGPIGFLGLIVPHIVKHYMNKNYLLIVPLTFIVGADLLLLSDVLSRIITFPFESPVGIVTSFIGASYFLLFTIRGVRRVD